MPFDGCKENDMILEILQQARFLINRGWRKGEFYKNNSYCTVGAYRQAFQLYYGIHYGIRNNDDAIKMDVHKADELISLILFKELPLSKVLIWSPSLAQLVYHKKVRTLCLINYNDCGSTGKDDVLDLFDRAIAKRRETLGVFA